MEVEKKKEVQIKLTLHPSEAEWLKELMQNPMTPMQDPTLETPRNEDMRELFWNELSKCLD